jgi:anti-sigma factor RsiW
MTDAKEREPRMNKLHTDDMMAYVDGTLDESRLAQVEEYLKTHAEDAALLADMKMALTELHAWDEAEPVRVSENFWPALRDKLPEAPKRNWLRGTTAQLGVWLWPSHSPLRLSARVAVIAAFIALAASFFAPKDATVSVQAGALTAQDQAFIQQSMARHDAYVTSQSLSGGSTLLRTGDGRDSDGDGDDTDTDPYTP